jgi:hypothetical protein
MQMQSETKSAYAHLSPPAKQAAKEQDRSESHERFMRRFGNKRAQAASGNRPRRPAIVPGCSGTPANVAESRRRPLSGSRESRASRRMLCGAGCGPSTRHGRCAGRAARRLSDKRLRSGRASGLVHARIEQACIAAASHQCGPALAEHPLKRTQAVCVPLV